jgi:hypothetical protein
VSKDIDPHGHRVCKHADCGKPLDDHLYRPDGTVVQSTVVGAVKIPRWKPYCHGPHHSRSKQMFTDVETSN